MAPPDASICVPDASGNLQVPLRCLQMPPDASKCLLGAFQMSPDASRCLPDASRCYQMPLEVSSMPPDVYYYATLCLGPCAGVIYSI